MKSPCFLSSVAIALSTIPPEIALQLCQITIHHYQLDWKMWDKPRLKNNHVAHLWQMTKRIMTPFSSSSFFLFSPVFHGHSTMNNSCHKNASRIEGRTIPCGRKKPCGIQVLRMESLLLQLLKAVLMLMIMRYLCLPDDSKALYSCETGEPLRNDSCSVLAAGSSVSKFPIVLSSVLQEEEPFEL